MTATAKIKTEPKGVFETVTGPLKEVGKTFEVAREKALERNREFSVRVIEYAETNTREAFGAARAVAGAKTLTELLEIQNSFVRDQVARSANQARDLGELFLSATKDAWKPITSKLAGAEHAV